MKQAHERSKFYNEMRLARVLNEMDLIDTACNWQEHSIVCDERNLKARVFWRQLMSEANSIEIELGY